MAEQEYYPLRLGAIMKEKIWGGRNLERLLGKPLEPERQIGETWEAWDGCLIENGTYGGVALSNLVATEGAAILGSAATSGRFPLLFKFIDAQDDLSVQVHPDDAGAQALEQQPYGKTEAWYIIHAEPGARLIHGFREDVDAERVSQHLAQKKLADLLSFVPVQRGDVVFVPARTVHAIGKGIVLAEIQENSDITYRLYDWGRVGHGRDLHVSQSLKVAEFKGTTEHKIPPLTIHGTEFDRRVLAACRYFALELMVVRAPCHGLRLNDKFNIVSILQGAAAITYGKGARVEAKQGQTLLLPARLGAFGIAPTRSPCRLLQAYVPDLRTEVIEPLTRAGHNAASIARLGGASQEHNDLIPLLGES